MMSIPPRYSTKLINPDFYGRIRPLDLAPLPPPPEIDHEYGCDFKGMAKKSQKFDHSLQDPGYVPVVTKPFRKPGRFPLLSKLRDIPVPPTGTLVRSVTGRKQFGIVGCRNGTVGVFWALDGWVGDYAECELKTLFDSCLEIDS